MAKSDSSTTATASSCASASKLHPLFPPNTLVIDFGYSVDEPLRMGHFKLPLMYNGGVTIKGLKQSTEFDDYSSDSSEQVESDVELVPIDNDQDILRTSKDFGAPYTREQLAEYSAGEINRKAIALFDFTPENDNEVGLCEGQVIWISYRHGQGWLVAEDPVTGEHGLVPEAYVEILLPEIRPEDDVDDDEPKRFLPEIFNEFSARDSEDEWVDTDFDDNVTESVAGMTIHE